MVTDSERAADPRDALDTLRERIRSGDLSSIKRDQLDHLVLGVAVAERRAGTAIREFPGEVAVQRAVSAGAWATVAHQLRVLLGDGAGWPDDEVPPRAPGSPGSARS